MSLVVGKKADYDELAKECVGMANARGGHIFVGIENDAGLPPAEQRIDDNLIGNIHRRISQITVNVTIAPQKRAAENGGEFVDVEVLSSNSIACTTDGRYFLRISDENRRLMPDDLGHLFSDKAAFVWEIQTSQQVPQTRRDEAKFAQFVEIIRASERVSNFVKEKSPEEMLEHYLFVKDGFLTNLGVLWIGERNDRARLSFAPTVQFIKYDERENKVDKLPLDDYYQNPFELIETVLNDIPDWRLSYEMPDGMFRKSVPHYPLNVVRELIVNAVVHRPYTQRGDVFINLYTDRLEIVNPGLLPVGVTPQNILHVSVARNPHLAQVFRDLKLMEREGSGYDSIYDALLSNGKAAPEVIEGSDRVTVIVRKRIINPVIIDFVAKADETYQLTRKERVALGLILQHESLTAIELAKHLELNEVSAVRHWLGRLQDLEIINTRGRTKGTEYFVEPRLLRKLEFKGKTSLKTIEDHRLRELIIQDLRRHQDASLGEIHLRIGEEIPRRRLQYEIQKLVDEGNVAQTGERRWTRYSLT